MLCLPTVKKIGFSNGVVARCEFRILGMEVRQQAGGELAPGPKFFFSHPPLHPALPGVLCTHVDTPGHKTELWLAPYTSHGHALDATQASWCLHPL